MRTTFVISHTGNDSFPGTLSLRCEGGFRLLCQRLSGLIQTVGKSNLLVLAITACYLVVLLLVGSD